MDNHESHDQMTQRNPISFEDIEGPPWRNRGRFKGWDTWEIN